MRLSAAALFVSLVLTVLSPAARGDLTMSTTSAWNGTSPTAPSSWLSASFTSGPGSAVTLTLSATHLSTNNGNAEDVQDWLFNLDPALDPSKLSFSFVNQVGSFTDPTINATSQDAQKTQGNVPFDIDFGFATGNPSNRFVQGDSITYTITYGGSGTFNANSFNFTTSQGNFGPLYSSAHIQNTGSKGNGSGDIGATTVTVTAVPEPAVASLMVLSALGACLRKRR